MNIKSINIISVPNLGRSMTFPCENPDKQFDRGIIEDTTVSTGDQSGEWLAPKSIRSKQVKIQVAMIVLFIIGCIILAFPVR
jgi:hypothetical protein